jgi:hypothetical protein
VVTNRGWQPLLVTAVVTHYLVDTTMDTSKRILAIWWKPMWKLANGNYQQ